MAKKRKILYNNDFRPAYTQNNPDIVPFGTHRGKLIKDTPRQWREWMILNFKFDKSTEELKKRIIWANLEEINR